MNFPDLICLLHYDWKSTAFSRVTRLAEKKKKNGRIGEHCKNMYQDSVSTGKKESQIVWNLYLDI